MSRVSLVILIACFMNTVPSFAADKASMISNIVNPDQPMFDESGLTLKMGDTRDHVDSSRWSLSSKENISTYTPNDKVDSIKEVRILRDPSTSKIMAVRSDVKVPLAENEKVESTGFWNGLFNSVANPGVKIVSTYRLKDAIVQEAGGKVEAVNKEMCRALKKDFNELNECANKLDKIANMKNVLNANDLQALKDLSDDSDKEATNVHASVPKKIWQSFAMCNELDKYSKLDQVDVVPVKTKPAPAKEGTSK